MHVLASGAGACTIRLARIIARCVGLRLGSSLACTAIGSVTLPTFCSMAARVESRARVRHYKGAASASCPPHAPNLLEGARSSTSLTGPLPAVHKRACHIVSPNPTDSHSSRQCWPRTGADQHETPTMRASRKECIASADAYRYEGCSSQNDARSRHHRLLAGVPARCPFRPYPEGWRSSKGAHRSRHAVEGPRGGDAPAFTVTEAV